MIDRPALTAALRALVTRTEDDLRSRAAQVPEVAEVVEAEFAAASSAGRTSLSKTAWAESLYTQVAVAWVLAGVFVRFCEDNDLIADPVLSGPGARRNRAVDAQQLYFRSHPAAGERDYLTASFDELAHLPGLGQVLAGHNPLRLFGPTDDGCRALLDFWRDTDPDTGDLRWDFTDPTWDTRFLGDLYQDLSEAAKKQYALLQTPDFVEAFILDRTLEPAIDEFGLEGFAMIDPACGSGHFLLGAFDRMVVHWEARRPDLARRALVAIALESINGVDLNPFAVAIARFRLLVAALRSAEVRTLADAPAFVLQIATGDALLHGPEPGRLEGLLADVDRQANAHLFATEDGDLVKRILGRSYHAVVANPPYITPKDPAANQAYRDRFHTCHRQYSLAVPFMEQIFNLAVRGGDGRSAGFTGQITANSFTKREFGKKLIEQFLADEVDLTHVIDTSGGYIPGHGTPTVILFGRNQLPVGDHVRAVLGIRGEPSTPAEPAKGQVWTSIIELVDHPGGESDFVSSDDLARRRLRTHPWSLQGGGAQAAVSVVESAAAMRLFALATDIGRTTVVGEDDAWILPSAKAAGRVRLRDVFVPLVIGESVRDYRIDACPLALYPYDRLGGQPYLAEAAGKHLWPVSTLLRRRSVFGKFVEERGEWFEHLEHYRARLQIPLSIGFAFVATHNHFILDRGGKLFNRTAPAIKLAAGASVDDHLELLGPLNSSVGCFWMKQVFHNKGNGGIGGGIGDEDWEPRYEFDGTKLKKFPLPSGSALDWAAALDGLAQDLDSSLPAAVVASSTPDRTTLTEAQASVKAIRARMVAVQDELDWRCLYLYGLISEDLSLPPNSVPGIERGQRAFEIVMARQVAAGELETSWFERHGSTPIIELPVSWPDEYRAVVESRIALIESDPQIGLLERPEYKRRWNWASWDSMQRDALRGWLLDRLESPSLWSGGRARSVGELADALRGDAELMGVVELHAGTPDVDLADALGQLVVGEAVPYLSAWRYKDTGLRKRAEWEATWTLQRREDAGEDVGDIPVPPKYGSGDFRSTAIWSLRGKLDVPKERFVSYPGIGRDTDPTLLIGWAGWDHLQQATALAGLYEQRRSVDGWNADQLTPILAGVAELIPWLQQWHNDLDPATGQRLGDFFASFVEAECATLGIARETLGEWRPPAATRGRRARKA